MNEKKSIKEWAPDDQPREKMIAKGKAALSDSELLAILLRTGKEGQSAVELARALLDSVDNNLISLSNLSLNDLMRHKGIGEAKAITIMAALELGRRRRAAEVDKPMEINNSRTSFELFLPYIDDPRQEHFLVMYLNQGNYMLKVECVSNGGITRSIVDPKIIFKQRRPRLQCHCRHRLPQPSFGQPSSQRRRPFSDQEIGRRRQVARHQRR